VALPSGLVLWVLTAPLFRLRTVEVGGPSRRVGSAWVRQVLAPLMGVISCAFRSPTPPRGCKSNPWIEKVEIEKELPAGLRVKLAERAPVALLLSGQNLLMPTMPAGPSHPWQHRAELEEARKSGLLVVSFVRDPHPTGIGVAAALKVAAELGRVQTDWAAKLAQIEVLGEEDFRLHTDALPFPLLVTAGRWDPKFSGWWSCSPSSPSGIRGSKPWTCASRAGSWCNPSQTSLLQSVKNTTSTF